MTYRTATADGNVDFLSWFGDGYNGSISITANAISTGVKAYDTFTLASGASYDTQSYPIFCKNSFTIDVGCVLHANANHSVGSVPGIPGGYQNHVGRGCPAAISTTGRQNSYAYGFGGTGGRGGTKTMVYGRHTGSYDFAIAVRPLAINPYSVVMVDNSMNTTNKRYAGGGHGGLGRTGSTDAGTEGPWSPVGGSGGGVVAVCAKNFVNNGTVSANGGNGANAASASYGGAGGGGAGWIGIVYRTKSGTGTYTAYPGRGGSGTAGIMQNGEDGASGSIIFLRI